MIGSYVGRSQQGKKKLLQFCRCDSKLDFRMYKIGGRFMETGARF